MEMIKVIKKESNQEKNKDIIEIVVWSMLYLSFKIEIMKTLKSNIKKETSMLSSEEYELSSLIKIDGKYPSSYVLMYRQYFLDEV